MPVFLVVAAAAIHQYIRHRQQSENGSNEDALVVSNDRLKSCNTEVTNDDEPEEKTLEKKHAIFDMVSCCCAPNVEINRSTSDNNHHDSVVKDVNMTDKDAFIAHSKQGSSSCVFTSSDEEESNDTTIKTCGLSSTSAVEERTFSCSYNRLPTDETVNSESEDNSDNNIIETKRKGNIVTFPMQWQKFKMNFSRQGVKQNNMMKHASKKCPV